MLNTIRPSFPALMGIAIALTATAASAGQSQLDIGKDIFTNSGEPPCALCHALKDAGSDADIGPNLNKFRPTIDQVKAAVSSGIGVMPSFKDSLSESQINAVAEYVSEAALK